MYDGYTFSISDSDQFERLKNEFNSSGEYYIDDEGDRYVVRRNVVTNEEIVESIRIQRKYTCFPVVNRGQLWYESLSTEQLKELDSWYRSWLDAPKTLITPETPKWI